MPTKLSAKEEAAIKRENARIIRSDLNQWARFNGYEPAAHHRMMNNLLMKVTRREIKKLMLILPTGCGKSVYSSILFPPWYLGRHPKHAILACSHSESMATKFGRAARNVVDRFGEVLGYKMSEWSSASGEWETTAGGEYFAAGVTQRIAGRRCDAGLIDDPFGSKDDADSALYRDRVWDWYGDDFMSRLKPEAVIILITTRWHEDDLAGRLMARERGEWTIVEVPRVVETPTEETNDPLGRKIGEMLWPEYFTMEQDTELRKDARAYQAKQQGKPSAETGAFFTSDMLVGYNSYADIPAEESMRFYCASDHAVRTKQMNDLNCFIPFGVDSKGVIWILPDVWWKRGDTGEQVDQMFLMAKRRNPIYWFSGKDHITGSIGPFLRTRMSDENTYFAVVELSDVADKMKKAQAIHGMCSIGKVRFPKFDASWWPQARAELLSFPHGTHDDFCVCQNTSIQMADGSRKSIGAINRGDEIIGATGKTTVIDFSERDSAEVFRFRFSDGSFLDATPNHPVFASGSFKCIDALTNGDEVSTIHSWLEDRQKQKWWNIEGIATEGIHNPNASTSGLITERPSRVEDFYTDIFGKIFTAGKFLMDLPSTIRTRIHSTTQLRIWSACLAGNISDNMFYQGHLPSDRKTTWRPFGQRQQSGTKRQREESGIARWLNPLGVSESSQKRIASSAAKISRRLFLHGQNSAVSTAGRVTLASVTKLRPQPVFNLLTSDHTYFANGILTHNCDALANVGRGLLLQNRGQMPEREPEFKPFNIHSVNVQWLRDQKEKIDKAMEPANGW